MGVWHQFCCISRKRFSSQKKLPPKLTCSPAQSLHWQSRQEGESCQHWHYLGRSCLACKDFRDNWIPSLLPEHCWRDSMDKKTEEGIPNKYPFRECETKRSISSEQMNLSINWELLIWFWRDLETETQFGQNRSFGIKQLASIWSDVHWRVWAARRHTDVLHESILIYPECVWGKWEQFLQNHWLCLHLKRHMHTCAHIHTPHSKAKFPLARFSIQIGALSCPNLWTSW